MMMRQIGRIEVSIPYQVMKENKVLKLQGRTNEEEGGENRKIVKKAKAQKTNSRIELENSWGSYF